MMEIRVVRSGEDGKAIAHLDIETPDLHVEHTASGITLTGDIDTIRNTLSVAYSLSCAGDDKAINRYDRIVTVREGDDQHNKYFTRLDYHG